MKVIQLIETDDGFTMDSSRYPEYVETIKSSVPKNALNFMKGQWHYDPSSERCLHDAQVRDICIQSQESGERQVTNVSVELSGAYGNSLNLQYCDVRSYSIDKRASEWPNNDKYALGDLLIDEVLLGDDDRLTHEIEFTDATITIQCKDIIYSVTP